MDQQANASLYLHKRQSYLMEFHWWYLLVGFFIFIIFAKGKGGVVVNRVTANLEILDKRFAESRLEAQYSVFKKGSPDHIDIEVENLPVEAGEELEFQLNRKILAKVRVKRNREAEFDHWSDEETVFPVIVEGDELVIRYQNKEVLKGIFQ